MSIIPIMTETQPYTWFQFQICQENGHEPPSGGVGNREKQKGARDSRPRDCICPQSLCWTELQSRTAIAIQILEPWGVASTRGLWEERRGPWILCSSVTGGTRTTDFVQFGVLGSETDL